MSKTVNGLVLDTNDQEAAGTLTGLAAFVSNDLLVWNATSAAAIQEGTCGVVRVVLTDSEASANWAVKFTSSRPDISDCIVRYGNREVLYERSSGEDTQRCQRSGIRFPKSRIVTDGRGRQVGDRFDITPIKETPTYIP